MKRARNIFVCPSQVSRTLIMVGAPFKSDRKEQSPMLDYSSGHDPEKSNAQSLAFRSASLCSSFGWVFAVSVLGSSCSVLCPGSFAWVEGYSVGPQRSWRHGRERAKSTRAEETRANGVLSRFVERKRERERERGREGGRERERETLYVRTYNV